MTTKIHSAVIGVTDEGYYYVSADIVRDGVEVRVFDWLPDLVMGGPSLPNYWKGME